MANGFRPAENLLHLFAQAWTGEVTRNSGSAAVNRRLPVCAVLGHLRHRLQDTQRMEKVFDILALVATHAQAVSAGNLAFYCHLPFPLRRTGNRSEAGVARQSGA
jgi:hypothetical protein